MSNKASDSKTRYAGISDRIIDLSISSVDDSRVHQLLERYFFSTILVNERWVSIGVTGNEDDTEVISGDAKDSSIEALLSAVRAALEKAGGLDRVTPIEIPTEFKDALPTRENQE